MGNYYAALPFGQRIDICAPKILEHPLLHTVVIWLELDIKELTAFQSLFLEHSLAESVYGENLRSIYINERRFDFNKSLPGIIYGISPTE